MPTECKECKSVSADGSYDTVYVDSCPRCAGDSPAQAFSFLMLGCPRCQFDEGNEVIHYCQYCAMRISNFVQAHQCRIEGGLMSEREELKRYKDAVAEHLHDKMSYILTKKGRVERLTEIKDRYRSAAVAAMRHGIPGVSEPFVEAQVLEAEYERIYGEDEFREAR